MSRCTGIPRGPEALRNPKVPIATASSGRTHGGTVGEGTRQGTKRTVTELLAWDFDRNHVQEARLHGAFGWWWDEASRAQVCQGDGRHPNGLILVRPRRETCSATACACDADTRMMACRIGAGTTDGITGVRAAVAVASARARLLPPSRLRRALRRASVPALVAASTPVSACARARARAPASLALGARLCTRCVLTLGCLPAVSR